MTTLKKPPKAKKVDPAIAAAEIVAKAVDGLVAASCDGVFKAVTAFESSMQDVCDRLDSLVEKLGAELLPPEPPPPPPVVEKAVETVPADGAAPA